jgi:regulator of sirC expression with transglutaminase-like and TPR domain
MQAKKTVSQIAREIRQNWAKPYFGAVPYLNAMFYENYGFDGEKSIVLYFLSNASTYRGEIAKQHKKDLKEIVGIK